MVELGFRYFMVGGGGVGFMGRIFREVMFIGVDVYGGL